MDKKTVILDAFLELIKSDRGASCTISDIAKQAGIAKGGIYYYFRSKEEIMDALVERNYSKIIDRCQSELENHQLSAVEKIKLFFMTYYTSSFEYSLESFLHESRNAYSHQKSLTYLLKRLTPLVSFIFEQGIEEGFFSCPFPQEVAEIALADLCFVFDQGLFVWSRQEMERKLAALSYFLEFVLSAPKNSFSFLMEYPLDP